MDGGSAVGEACSGDKLFIAHTARFFGSTTDAGNFCRSTYPGGQLLEMDTAADFQAVNDAFSQVSAGGGQFAVRH